MVVNSNNLEGIQDLSGNVVCNWERLAQALNQHAIVSIADAKGNIVYANDLFCEISGYSQCELIGQNHRIVKSTHHSNRFYTEMWQTISAGQLWKGEVCNRRKDGSLYWVESSITPICDAYGKPKQYISIRTDVTAVKLAEQEHKLRGQLRGALSEIGQVLLSSSNPNIEPLIDNALNISQKTLGSSQITLFLQQTKNSTIAYELLSCAPSNRKQDCAQMRQNCLNLLQDADKFRYRITTLPRSIDNTLGEFPSRQAVVLPIHIGDQISGVLVVSYDHDIEPWWQVREFFVLLLRDMIISATKRSLTTAELARSKERLRRGQAYANIGTWEWDIRTDELFWSEKIAPLFGYKEGDLVTSYQNFINAVHPEDRKSVEQAVADAVEKDAPYDIEHRVVWPDGSVRWVLERGAVQRAQDGTPLRMIGVVQDVDTRKLAQLSLEHREAQLSQAQTLTKLVSWYADFKNKTFEASANFAELFGMEPDGSSSTVDRLHELTYPDDRAVVNDIYRQVLEGGSYSIVHRIYRADNRELRFVRGSGVVTLNNSGGIDSIQGTHQDITNLMLLEDRLRDMEQRFSFAVEGAGYGLWEFDVNNNRVRLSPTALSLLGYYGDFPESDDMPDTWRALIHPADYTQARKAIFDFAHGRADHFHMEVRLQHADGSYNWFLTQGSIIEYDQTGNASKLIGVNTNIDEIKQKEAELIRARNEAFQANQAKSEFLSNMSHELRTPLNAILGFGQLLELDDSLSNESKDNLLEILKAGRHLLALINEVLDLAKVEAGRSDLALEPVQVGPLITDICTLLRGVALTNSVELLVGELSDQPVKADPVKLKQVLINLINNAIKYNRKGGSVLVSTKQIGPSRLRIDVEDTGYGISPEKLADIFEPFNRLEKDKADIEGTGIGLTLTKKFVHMMGGELGVSSKVGVGSRFWVEIETLEFDQYLPVLAHSDKSPGETLPTTIQKTVLYIDDNLANLQLVKSIFKSAENIRYLEAHGGPLGLRTAQANQVDLILVDLTMPELDGFQLLELFRADRKLQSVPIIAVTAAAMLNNITKIKAAGFDGYITKPFDIGHFNNIVRHHLETTSTV
ncbi:PAS domain-containing protein [Halioxenophilus sp. WMMB6]|uniref:PAS domain-containing hybrid sensor histidine kinase/response regulator n=1 Tax=Halioxenophilus sp. WMMB6 TaxID=3073815 RepID=UPI00295E351C|nr:PAS domain-containing protein [Halioxenophilus sp. WMMB6]